MATYKWKPVEQLPRTTDDVKVRFDDGTERFAWYSPNTGTWFLYDRDFTPTEVRRSRNWIRKPSILVIKEWRPVHWKKR